jgi:Pyruvate/2-oxoacid:ferredoxin oxidoreductase delta subunit
MNGYMWAGVVVVCLFVLWVWLERWSLLQPSVPWALGIGIKKYGMKYLWDGRGLNIFAYGRFLPKYITVYQWFMKRMGEKGKKWMGDTYHAKVLTPELAKAIINVDYNIPLQDLGTRIIPYEKAREIMLDANPEIALTHCACRTSADSHCGPRDVCMAIGRPFTDFVLQHQPKTTRLIKKDEALKILEDSHKRGWVHNAYFKDAAFDQFYAICNCCTCCCTGQMAMKLGIDMVSASGYLAEVDAKECKGCRTCVTICPYKAVSMAGGKSVVDPDKCKGCSVCVSKCENKARKMVKGGKLDPLDVRKLSRVPAN